jgi:hypothetical protein
MRGASTHDGKLSGNRQLVEAYDKDKGRKSKHLSQRPTEHGGTSGGVHGEGGHDEIKHIVEEHGLAHKHVITKHDGTQGGGSEYHSETHHESGHVHHADHASLDEAHDHGRQAMEDTQHSELSRDDQHIAQQKDRQEAAGGMGRGGDTGFMTE